MTARVRVRHSVVGLPPPTKTTSDYQPRVTASRDGRCATSSTTEPRTSYPGRRGDRATRWSRSLRSKRHETPQLGAGTGVGPGPGSPRLATVAARPPRRPSARTSYCTPHVSVVEEGAQRLSRDPATPRLGRSGFQPRVATSRDGRCATSSTNEAGTSLLATRGWDRAEFRPRVIASGGSVVEEVAKQPSRDLATRGWD